MFSASNNEQFKYIKKIFAVVNLIIVSKIILKLINNYNFILRRINNV